MTILENPAPQIYDFTKSAHNRNRIVTSGVYSIVMDIDALHSALLSITVVSEKVRAAREKLSATGDAPAGLGKFLREVENDLRMAQATLGGELGFSLCPRCWPPELVATDLDGELNCPVCGRVSYEQAA